MTNIKPFRIDIPQSDLDDLADRLSRTRFADELPGYGVPVARVRELVEYWRDHFDWRALEARLNAYPQFTTEIDGQHIHFLHVRSSVPDAFPLILTHGWPGSVVEYLDVIEPLTAAGYDLVIPSMPGYGFSGPTTETGWSRYRIAQAWASLMDLLGYDRYEAVGNDGGSMISPEVGRIAPDHVVGVHVTQIFSFPSGDPAEMAGLSEEETAALAHLKWFWDTIGAFNVLHSQQPQTVAHALMDSPAGLAGWNGQLMLDQDLDFTVANLAVYWLTRTAASAIRLYREDSLAQPPTGPTTVPLALASFAGDFQSIRRFAERDHKNIVSWHTYGAGGHYAAHQATEDLVTDIVSFFGKARA
ncbi:epoxide hydrolase family protein [Amycolatopsis sp. GM8]|uniref:epoxide hydrolase family protein n=1 Tax=Amycolatopsis sp. GM8 TaxID=2896530 RepID=UPI001F1D4100|nr:epoxide hydrolase family protein [Amycolatopsis sp. GM8]